jgi:predicted ATPase/DNA-binding SARP family transcriptional activator
VVFRVLGPFEVVADGIPVVVGGPQPRAVLAALVLQANQVVSTPALVDIVWGDRAPPSATAVVRTYASRLRRTLGAHADGGSRLVGRPPGYVLEVDRDRVDAHVFEQLVVEARRARAAGRAEVAAAGLTRALALWRGAMLPELAEVEAFRPTVARLEEMRLTTIEERIDLELVLGRHAEAVVELEALTGHYPLRERLWGQFVVALYRAGRQTDALTAYQTVRSRLVHEMGLEPGPELRALERQVLDQADELLGPSTHHGTKPSASDTSPPHGEPPPRSGRASWPVQLTRFFGRAAEVHDLGRLAREERLVTVVGPPGCGKTRLAIEAGARLADELPAGVRFVDLAPVADPGAVASAVAIALGVKEEPGRPMDETLIDALRSAQPRLLLLDNCEHVIDTVAELALRLIVACPSLRILATSRIALQLAGESVWHLQPLDQRSAMALFDDRARLVANRLRHASHADAEVAAICDRLDGLPLAIELAAASTRVLSLSQIAERLTRAPPVLTPSSRPSSPRHETIAATVDWSYQLLPPDARHTFNQLSVFAGTFDLEATTAVVKIDEKDEEDDEKVLAGLTTLVDHSLLVVDHHIEGPARYHMLEPVRQCAQALLAADGDDDTRHRHADHYLTLARRFDPWGHRHVETPLPLRRLEQEETNLQAALAWAEAHATDLFVQSCEALAPFWEFGARVNTGRMWTARMLASTTTDQRARATAQAWAARLAWRQGDYEAARRLLDDSLAVVRELDDPLGEALTRRVYTFVALSDGDTETALQHAHTSVALCRAADDTIGVTWALFVLGWAHYAEGDLDRGDEHMRAALAANQAVGNPTATAHALFGLQYGAMLAGDPVAQRAHLIGALDAVQHDDGYLDMTDWLWSSAILAATEGRYDAAMRLVGGAEAQNQRRGSRYPQQLADRVLAAFGPVSDHIPPDQVGELTAQGKHMDWDQLLAEALAEPTNKNPPAPPPDTT